MLQGGPKFVWATRNGARRKPTGAYQVKDIRKYLTVLLHKIFTLRSKLQNGVKLNWRCPSPHVLLWLSRRHCIMGASISCCVKPRVPGEGGRL